METDTSVASAERHEPALDRTLIRLGVHDHVARIIAATPSLRASWLLAAFVVTAFALWGDHADPRLLTIVALLAPILPIAGVAAAYGPWADPMFEITQASPASGSRVLLLRSVAVLVSSAALVVSAAAFAPTTGLDALAWLLPALALSATSLMLATYIPLPAAACLVAFGWLLLAASVAFTQPAATLFRGPAQLVFCVTTIVASFVLTRRRHHLDVANLHTKRALVDAADAERRRMERNLHDGAQQELVAIGVKAGIAATLVHKDPAKAIAIIDQVRADAQSALQGLRDLTRGACPPILADSGLAAALDARARAAGLPVLIDAIDVERLPRQIEIAAYYCCSEAFQNAAKYAKATAITVTIRVRAGGLTVRVADDGAGFDTIVARRGVGMRSMAERVESLGGTFEVRSSLGGGTEISAVIPIRTYQT